MKLKMLSLVKAIMLKVVVAAIFLRRMAAADENLYDLNGVNINVAVTVNREETAKYLSRGERYRRCLEIGEECYFSGRCCQALTCTNDDEDRWRCKN